jgi:Holliday junction resolvase RusA-like endonuclease
VIGFIVRGAPATQGSKTPHAVRRKDAHGEWEYTGKVTVVEGKTKASQQKFTSWREAVKSAAVEAMKVTGASGPEGLSFPLEGPLEVAMIFTLRRPKGHYRSGKSTSHLLRDGAPDYPHVKPDAGKLARAVEDAMTDAGLYRDDAQIVCYRPLIKVYDDHPLALPAPGVAVTVRYMPKRHAEELRPPDRHRARR